MSPNTAPVVLETAGNPTLALTDIAYKIVAVILLTPLVGILFRVVLAVSGNTVLADADAVEGSANADFGYAGLIYHDGDAAYNNVTISDNTVTAAALSTAGSADTDIDVGLFYVSGEATFDLPPGASKTPLLIPAGPTMS